jgi:hypothetical protein
VCSRESSKCLAKDAAEEVEQEAIRILEGSCEPKYNLTSEEMRSVWVLKANEELTVLPPDKDIPTVVVKTIKCNWLIASLVEDQVYRELEKSPIKFI